MYVNAFTYHSFNGGWFSGLGVIIGKNTSKISGCVGPRLTAICSFLSFCKKATACKVKFLVNNIRLDILQKIGLPGYIEKGNLNPVIPFWC